MNLVALNYVAIVITSESSFCFDFLAGSGVTEPVHSLLNLNYTALVAVSLTSAKDPTAKAIIDVSA